MAMSLALSSVRLDGFRQGSPATVPASFSATLLSSLVPEVFTGSSTPTMTRATTAMLGAYDSAGTLLKQVPSGCARLSGARFVRNLHANKSENVLPSLTGTSPPTASLVSYGGKSNVVAIVFPSGAASGADSRANWFNGSESLVNPWILGASYRGAWSIATSRALTGGETIRVEMSGNHGMWSVDITAGSQPGATLTRMSSAVTTAGGTGADAYYISPQAALGSAITVYFTEWQTELVSGQSNQNPSDYVSVGVLSAPYHGAGVDGCKYFATQNGNTVAGNVVTEATGAAISSATLLGYQAEGARTNLLTYSNDLTNAAWVKTTMTTALTSTGPDGVANSATRCTASAGNALVLQTIVAAASSRTSSFWVKRITGTGNFELTQDGIAFTAATTTAAWTKVELNASILNATVGFRIVTNGDAFDIWCGQFEAGAFSSSPIPTTTVAVARNADVLSYASASNWSSTTGTAYCEALARVGLGAYFISSFNGTGGIPLRVNGATVSIYDGSVNLNGAAITTSNTAIQKMASAWGGITAATAVGGTATATGAFDGDVGADTNFWIGADNSAGSTSIYGTIRNVALYTTKKTNAELAALTA